jgi:signal transduction histidine kinase
VRVQARGGEGTVRLEVTDSGPGLTRPLSRLLRGRGWGRGWAAATGRHGHGLPVAASVAAAHGGRLLSAPSDRGARLALELPLANTHEGRARNACGAPWIADHRGLR